MRLCAGSILSLFVLAHTGTVSARPQAVAPTAQQPGLTQQQDEHSDVDVLVIGVLGLGVLMAGTLAALALTRHGMRSSH